MKQQSTWRAVGLTLSSAVLLWFAFEPALYPFTNWLVLVAMWPFFLALRMFKGKRAVWLSALFGSSLMAHQMFWIVPFSLRWTGNFGLSILPYAIILFLAGIVWTPLGWVVSKCFERKQLWLIPFVWVSHDVFRAYLPELAFPWSFLGTPLVQFTGLVQHAAWGMVYLVTATVVAINLGLMFLIPQMLSRWRSKDEESDVPIYVQRQAWGLLAIGFALPLLASSRLLTPPPATKRSFLLVQHGVDMAFSDHDGRYDEIARATGEALTKMSSSHPDLAVFPEGFSAVTAYSEPPLTPLGLNPPSPVIFGSFHQVGDKTHQAAYAYDGHWQWADKTKLVVMGEFVPFRQYLPFLQEYHLGGTDLTPGKELVSLKVGGIQLGQMICFEAVFPELGVKQAELGAQVFVQMSIDDWYAGTQAHTQLWESSLWRSIENGLPMVRVGSRGTSLVTDFRGRIVRILPEGSKQIESVEVGIPARSDAFAGRYWFVWLSVALGLGTLILELWRSVKARATHKNVSPRA